MTDINTILDFVTLLQDLGKDVSVEVIAQFLIRNPDLEDPLATQMGALLSSPEQIEPNEGTSTSNQSPGARTSPRNMPSFVSGDSLKMILVVNMDLDMGRGKQCAQCAHAALGLYLQIKESRDSGSKRRLNDWIDCGQKKIVVKGKDLDELKQVRENAKKINLPCHIVADAGHTQIAPGSKTVLAILGTDQELQPVTGHLKLL